MNVVFATDSDYLQHLAVALTSLLENNSGTYPTIEKYINKTVDYYARVEAMQRYENRESFSVVKIIFELIKTFIMTYFVRRGFLDGTRGLILSVHYSVYRFNVWANLWFLEQQKKNQR